MRPSSPRSFVLLVAVFVGAGACVVEARRQRSEVARAAVDLQHRERALARFAATVRASRQEQRNCRARRATSLRWAARFPRTQRQLGGLVIPVFAEAGIRIEEIRALGGLSEGRAMRPPSLRVRGRGSYPAAVSALHALRASDPAIVFESLRMVRVPDAGEVEIVVDLVGADPEEREEGI